jgi:hypothetical protein
MREGVFANGAMPTVVRHGPYRLYFYSADGFEPMHVHIIRDKAVAKIWIRPMRVESNRGYGAKELRSVLRIVKNYRKLIEREWNEFFEGE